jgi:beta-glucosidase
MSFAKDFIWGTATSAYQVEGSIEKDGKLLSVWDSFCERKGAILDGTSGEVACDHYNRYMQDIALMSEIGIQAYRLSLSWPRVMNTVTGEINTKGLDYYDALVDELLSKNIQPWITLFHWDYPLDLFRKGGWLHPSSSDWFADYTKVVVERLSDRVRHWFTINEPQCFVLLGHQEGTHAPGIQLGQKDVFTIVHNVLLSHGKAVKMIREYSKQPSYVGYAPAMTVCCPLSDSPEDIHAAEKGNFSSILQGMWSSDVWMDPVFFGAYSHDTLTCYEEYLPEIKDGDMEIISQPVDYMGMNIYRGFFVSVDSDGKIIQVKEPEGFPRTAIQWPVTPESLYWGPKLYYKRYGKPVIISENGMSNTDWIFMDGQVHDVQRIDFLTRYLSQLKKASQEGVAVRGYFHWSLMDNFEWGYGYSERFGLIYVDYHTQKRVVKDSGHWYKKVIQNNGEFL